MKAFIVFGMQKELYLDIFSTFKNRHENEDLFKSHLLLCQTSTSVGKENVSFLISIVEVYQCV